MIRYFVQRSSIHGQGFYSHGTKHYSRDYSDQNHSNQGHHQGRTIEGEFHRDD